MRRSRKLTVNQLLEQFFIRNEAREEKWTDEALLAWVLEKYPNSAVRSVARIRKRRMQYNEGTGAFRKAGPAGTPDRPISYAYNEKGERIMPSVRREARLTEDRVREIAAEVASSAVDEDRVRQIVKETVRPTITIVVPKRSEVKLDGERVHRSFHKVMKKVAAGVPVLLVGPAGSGKTTLAAQVAKALGLPFTFNSMSEGISESTLLGRSLPDETGAWHYRPSPFVISYTEGGVHLLDEIDAADPNLLVQVNAAIANGKLSIPFARPTPFERHENSVIIAAANTYGNGADRQYVGRNQLDAATVDRYRMGTVAVDYDRDLERQLIHSLLDHDMAEALLNWGWGVRDRIAEARLRRIMSTRVLVDAAKLLKVGEEFSEVVATYFEGWSSDEKARVQ